MRRFKYQKVAEKNIAFDCKLETIHSFHSWLVDNLSFSLFVPNFLGDCGHLRMLYSNCLSNGIRGQRGRGWWGSQG